MGVWLKRKVYLSVISITMSRGEVLGNELEESKDVENDHATALRNSSA